MDIATLFVRLQADVADFEKKMGQVRRSVSQTGEAMQGLGRTLTIGLTVPLTALAAVSLKAAADFDSLQRGLEAVTGSAEEAAAQFDRLREIAKLPAVDLQQAAQASLAFQSIGKSAEFAERTIKGVANAVAVSGGGAEAFSGVMRQLRQVAGLGRLMGDELNIILEAAPAMGRALQNAFGTTSAEAIRKLGLTADEFFERLQEGMESLPQVQGGVTTAFENLQSSMKQAAAVIGEQLLPAVLPLVEAFTDMLEGMRKLDPETVRLVIAFGVMASTVAPLLIVLGKLLGAFTALATALKVGLLPLIVTGGPLVIALTVLGGLFIKNKLDALAAKDAVDDYTASLGQLTEQAAKWRLDENIAAMSENLRKQAATPAKITQAIFNLGGGIVTKEVDNPELAKLKEEAALLSEQFQILTRRVGSFLPAAETKTPPGPPVVDPLAEAAARAASEQAARALTEALEVWSQAQADAVDRMLQGRTGGIFGISTDFQRDQLEDMQRRARGGLDLRPRTIGPAGTTVQEAGGGGFFGDFFGGLKEQVTGLFASFGPLAAAAAVLAPVFEGLMSALGPTLSLLAEPLRTIGTLVGNVIAPALEVLAPILRLITTAFSYVIEAIGRVIRGIGDLLNKLPGSIGDPFKKFGQNMIDSAKAAREVDEAMSDLASSTTNVPIVFARALRTFQASTGGIGGGGGIGTGGGGGIGPGTTPLKPMTFNAPITVVASSPEQFAKQMESYGARVEWRAGYNPLGAFG